MLQSLRLESSPLKSISKGALGVHFSNYKRTANLTEITDWDAGFFGGAGLGV